MKVVCDEIYQDLVFSQYETKDDLDDLVKKKLKFKIGNSDYHQFKSQYNKSPEVRWTTLEKVFAIPLVLISGIVKVNNQSVGNFKTTRHWQRFEFSFPEVKNPTINIQTKMVKKMLSTPKQQHSAHWCLRLCAPKHLSQK